MNTSQIKAYAPKARQDFIKAVTTRAHLLGLDRNPDKIKTVEVKGDVAFINNQVFPVKVGKLRKSLEARIAKEGFDQVMEHVAYTWFNRFMALRYMELHGYLSHGCRVLSNPSGSHIPEILEHAIEIDLLELNREEVMELKLAGNKDEELYALLIKAQCHALYRAMPFLFERLDDETELLLPDNLLHSGSLVHKLVEEIDEESWNKVEIIGWIYQFYISEKKDQVIGKVVKSEDIPAATQLFTPNWIVKYMVQNSLGRMWLATYPDSSLRKKMEYYIEPAEQTPEVLAELDAITPKSLNPEELTLLDPACGSGHILVEAYDIFKEIYLERGYRTRDIPRLILEKNLYGLDIDDRAAQLTGFALMMKARADNHNIFNLEQPIDLSHFRSIASSACLDGNVIADALLKETVRPIVDEGLLFPETKRQQILTVTENSAVQRKDIIALMELFKDAKTFGSLIAIPDDLAGQLPALYDLVDKDYGDDWNKQDKAEKLKPIIVQATILAGKYDSVVANPPYMGGQGMNTYLRGFAQLNYPHSKSDLFAIFTERIMDMVPLEGGYIGLMTPFTWMFLSSYEKYRKHILESSTLESLIRPEYHAFFESAYVPLCSFILFSRPIKKYIGTFIDLNEFYGASIQSVKAKEAITNPNCGWIYYASASDFSIIPGSPLAYWLNNIFLEIFQKGESLHINHAPRKGLTTANNERFVRFWHEIDMNKFSKCNGTKWFPMTKGGAFRKWYGNNECVINWEEDGRDIKSFTGSVVRNERFYFQEGGTWNDVAMSSISIRYTPPGYINNASGPIIYSSKILEIIGLLNSKVATPIFKVLSPTMKYEIGSVGSFPILPNENVDLSVIDRLINIAKMDWDSYELSWEFREIPLLMDDFYRPSLKETYTELRNHWCTVTTEMRNLEFKNNRSFILAYGLQDEINAEASLEEVTLTCNPCYRYGNGKNEEELKVLLQSDSMKDLISYALGCMMGRYSLDEPGLIYAHSSNIGFEPDKYKTFLADDDGIVPITDISWFDDDATNRFVEFIKVAWASEKLEENLKFIAASLDPKSNEEPEDAIRKYMNTSFFKDHLKTYKRKPIYWLFSSGKYKAFECLVYLHRYNDATLSRMRSSYVIPLQGKISGRIDYLKRESDAADSTATKRRLTKEMDLLIKKQAELKTFDEELRHYADLKISMDLDDGVKVNYAKFGNLLAEVKTVTGKEE